MWERWQKDGTRHPIAQLFDRHHPSIARVFGRDGRVSRFRSIKTCAFSPHSATRRQTARYREQTWW